MTEGRNSGRSGLLAPLADSVRERTVSAVALVEESLRRIDAGRDLNAVIALRADEARAEAAELDAAIRGGTEAGPLAGLPLLVKDIEDVAGMTTSFGSRLHINAPAAVVDGPAVAALRRAGAIVVGKTNVPEFAFQGFTDNAVFGPTRNPWDPSFSPGGSSGGSAAALAAGLVPLASATDVGGSIRIPAALCGLVGLKPSSGVVARDPQLASADFNAHGPICGTVADARLLLGILGASGSRRTARTGGGNGGGSWPRRLLVTERFTHDPRQPTPTVALAFRAAVRQMEDALGLESEEVDLRRVFPAGYETDDWMRIVGYDQARALGEELLEREAANLDPVFLGDMRWSLGIAEQDHLDAILRTRRYRDELDAILQADAILITPTLTVEGWTPEGRLPNVGPIGLPSHVFNTEPANLTGHPALSVPAGEVARDHPFGLQIIGPRFADFRLLDVATALEVVAPWPLVAPGFLPFDVARLTGLSEHLRQADSRRNDRSSLRR